MRPGYLLDLGQVPYRKAWELQRSLAGAVSQGAIPDTVILLEHPPVITLGRRTEEGELHVPDAAEVDVVETDRGGKSTYHGPGQLVCYPILDLGRHGQDVKRYCRDLEEALIRTIGGVGVEATRIEGLTGIWVKRPAGPPEWRAACGVRGRGRGASPGGSRRRPGAAGRRGRSRRSASTSRSGSRHTATR